jgi:hypothetical protein
MPVMPAKRKLVLTALAAVAVLASGAAARAELAGPSSQLVSRSVDAHLCPFPLQVTIDSTAKPAGIRGLWFLAPSTVTLRDTSTGRTATLRSTGSYSVKPDGAVTWQGQRLWVLATGAHVPFLSTVGKGRLAAPQLQLVAGALHPRVIDPCALVAPSPPSTAPLATKAPWGLPPYALSRIGYAGLTPVLAALVRHDHVHLDVIVNGHAVTVPAGVGMAEPVDNGPCPSIGGKPMGDCATGRFYTFAVAVAPIHTHSTSGLIHIETDRPATFTLGEFFDEWGVRLTKGCVGGYCTGGGKQLRVYVDGRRVANPRGIVLTNHQEIAVVYGTAGRFRSVPRTYTGGWPGAGCGGAGEPSCLLP